VLQWGLLANVPENLVMDQSMWLLKNKLRALPTLLQQLRWCSVYGPVKEYWMKKSQNMLVWLGKLVVAQHPICTLSFSLMSGIGKT
jgi:hypothetical protein